MSSKTGEFYKCSHFSCCHFDVAVTVLITGPWQPHRWAGVTKVIKGPPQPITPCRLGWTPGNSLALFFSGLSFIWPQSQLLGMKGPCKWSVLSAKISKEKIRWELKVTKLLLKLSKRNPSRLHKLAFLLVCLHEHARWSLPPGWSLNYSKVVQLASKKKASETIIIRRWFLIPRAVTQSQLSFIWTDFP